MQHETVATPPSQGGVFCSPPLARAHVDCRNYRRQTGYKYISCSQTTGAGAHAREGAAAVNDAVAAFGSPRDFRHWSRTGLAKSSFYYALKKVKKIFHADKHWAKLHSTRKKRVRGLD